MGNILLYINALTDKDQTYAHHAFEILMEKSKENDDVYTHFDVFSGMMNHKNSYVRTRGILLLIENARWDRGNKYDEVEKILLSHIEDEKPITARQVIKGMSTLAKAKPDWKADIIYRLKNADISIYKNSMKPLVMKDIIEAITAITMITEK